MIPLLRSMTPLSSSIRAHVLNAKTRTMVMMISIYDAYAKALEKEVENLGHTVLLVVTVRLQCVVNEVGVPIRSSPGARERLGFRTPPGATGMPFILFKPHKIAKSTPDLSCEVRLRNLTYL